MNVVSLIYTFTGVANLAEWFRTVMSSLVRVVSNSLAKWVRQSGKDMFCLVLACYHLTSSKRPRYPKMF